MNRPENPSELVRKIRKTWKPREKKSHKGDFGRVFILAGSEGLTGAAHLTSATAVKTGAGLVTLGVPRKVYAVLARRSAEVMVRPFPSTPSGAFSSAALKPVLNFLKSQDVLALGPGISQSPETQRWARNVLIKNTLPAVLDADGLNAFRGQPGLLKKIKTPLILTPHPGEFARLFGRKVSSSQKDRETKAVWAAKTYGVYLVLKGSRTVVAGPKGELFINSTGNPGMAKGGSGDVLTGMIAALLGQKFSPWNAARFGVYIHGLSGDLAARKTGEVSLTSSDLIAWLPAAIRKIRGI